MNVPLTERPDKQFRQLQEKINKVAGELDSIREQADEAGASAAAEQLTRSLESLQRASESLADTAAAQ